MSTVPFGRSFSLLCRVSPWFNKLRSTVLYSIILLTGTSSMRGRRSTTRRAGSPMTSMIVPKSRRILPHSLTGLMTVVPSSFVLAMIWSFSGGAVFGATLTEVTPMMTRAAASMRRS